MTTVINKHTCPTCGQSINEREISLYSGMVKSLARLYCRAKQRGEHEFTRKEMVDIFKGSANEIARWGDWVYFGGLVYKPAGKGTWGLNMERCSAFLSNNLEIAIRVSKDPISKQITTIERGTVRDIKNLSSFLDENQQYIAKYL